MLDFVLFPSRAFEFEMKSTKNLEFFSNKENSLEYIIEMSPFKRIPIEINRLMMKSFEIQNTIDQKIFISYA